MRSTALHATSGVRDGVRGLETDERVVFPTTRQTKYHALDSVYTALRANYNSRTTRETTRSQYVRLLTLGHMQPPLQRSNAPHCSICYLSKFKYGDNLRIFQHRHLVMYTPELQSRGVGKTRKSGEETFPELLMSGRSGLKLYTLRGWGGRGGLHRTSPAVKHTFGADSK